MWSNPIPDRFRYRIYIFVYITFCTYLQEVFKIKPGSVFNIPDRVIAIKAVMRDVAATG